MIIIKSKQTHAKIIFQFVSCAGCAGQPGHLYSDHEERVHEDHHQHLPVQPRRGRPRHPRVRHAHRVVPDVETVSLDPGRGKRRISISLRIKPVRQIQFTNYKLCF